MQSQARIQNFKSPQDVLNSLSRITQQWTTTMLDGLSEDWSYNCNEFMDILFQSTVSHDDNAVNVRSADQWTIIREASATNISQQRTEGSLNINICKIRSIPSYNFDLPIEIECKYILLDTLVDIGLVQYIKFKKTFFSSQCKHYLLKIFSKFNLE